MRPKRTKQERETDLLFISRLYVRGLTLREIAASLNAEREYQLTFQTIAKDVKTILSRWRESIVDDVSEMRSAELIRINEIEREAWQAWTRSKKGADGDPRFLTTVQWCIERRCKLFGLDGPTKIAPTTPDGQDPYSGASREELLALAAALTKEEPDADESCATDS